MAINNVSELSTTAASNTDLAGVSILGTGLVSTADDSFRNTGAFLAKWWSDLGGVNTVGGTGDAITVTTPTVYTALKTGMRFQFIAGAANTGAATLNFDAIGAKAVRKISGGTDIALVAGDLVAGETYTLIYRASANSGNGAWVLVGTSISKATNAQAQVGTDSSAALTSSNLAAVLNAGTDNSGGATITMGDGGYFNLITSTTAITAFAFTNDAIGRTARVRFNTVRTLTYNATSLIIPGAASITTAVGDVAQIRSLGSGNFVVEWYTRAAAAVTSGLVLLTSGTVSAAATLDIVLSGYTGYRGFQFQLINLVPATDNVSLLARTSANGGSTYDSGATDYRWAQFGFDSSGTGGTGSAGGTSILLDSLVGNVSSEGDTSIVNLLGSSNTAIKNRIFGQTSRYGAGDVAGNTIFSGLRNTAAKIDAIRFLYSSGNIASGSYAVYGYV